MEILDLYYEDFMKAEKTMVRGESIPEGYSAMIIFVCIFNNEGKLLIQQRQATKKSWPSMWDVSAGGVVQSGESNVQAAKRELLEETGICLQESELTRVLTVYYDQEIHDIYTAVKDIAISDLKLQEEEVMDARWVCADEISRMIEAGRFIPVHDEFIQLIFAMKNKKGIMK